jgi:hypothetical protein
MSAGYIVSTSPTAAASRWSLDRIAGLAGLGFAIIVACINVFIGSLQPPAADAGANQIVAFVQDNKQALSVAFAAVPAGVFLLFAFGASAYPRLASGSREAGFWARFGLVGIVLVEVMFLTRTLFEVVLVANIDRLAGETAMVETLWQLQGATLTANGLALAVALTGLGRAGRLSNVIAAWQERMAYVAAALFVASAMAVVPGLEGSPIALTGLIAFVTWLIWLAMTSIRLMRSSEQPA